MAVKPSDDKAAKIVGIVVVVFVAVVFAVVAIVKSNSKPESANDDGTKQTLVSGTETSTAQTSVTEKPNPESIFGMEQNDTEGYNGISWGISLAAFVKRAKTAHSADGSIQNDTDQQTSVMPEGISKNGFVSDRDLKGILANLLGAETEYQWNLLPASLRYVIEKDAEYVFYHDHLALCIIPIESISEIKSNLADRYTVANHVEGIWMRPNLSIVQYEGTLFKRGSTNTRILLINFWTPGSPMSIYRQAANLIYVPNLYWTQIQEEISAAKDQEENAKKQESDEKTAKDLQKIQ